MLKATGIIRHIDELGRIVVPKELRKTLKIKDGTSMEIFTNDQNELILKKYSPAENITEFAEVLCDSIRQHYPVTILVTDNDNVIAAAGRGCDEVDSILSDNLYSLMETRRQNRITGSFDKYLTSRRNISDILVSPVIVRGDLYGSVIFVSFEGESINKDMTKVADLAVSLIQSHYN